MTLAEWFEMKGRRFMELKLKGGWKLIRNPECGDHELDEREIAEFFRMLGQLDGLLWMLQPDQPEEVGRFKEETRRFFKEREKEYKVMRNLPRGCA